MAPTSGLSLEDLIALAQRVSVFDEADLDELINFVRETDVCFTGTSEEVIAACDGNCCSDGSNPCLWQGEATVCPGSCLGKVA